MPGRWARPGGGQHSRCLVTCISPLLGVLLGTGLLLPRRACLRRRLNWLLAVAAGGGLLFLSPGRLQRQKAGNSQWAPSRRPSSRPPRPPQTPAPENQPWRQHAPAGTSPPPPEQQPSEGCHLLLPYRAWTRGGGRAAPTLDPHLAHVLQVSLGSPGQMNSPVGLGEAPGSHREGRAAPASRHLGGRGYFPRLPLPHQLKLRQATVQKRQGSPCNLAPVWESRAKTKVRQQEGPPELDSQREQLCPRNEQLPGPSPGPQPQAPALSPSPDPSPDPSPGHQP